MSMYVYVCVCMCLRAENRTSKMQVFDVSHMGGFGGGGGCNNVLGVCL